MSKMRELWNNLVDFVDDKTAKADPQAATRTAAENEQKNVQEATNTFGSGGSKFKGLKGADDLNPRQKTIFDDKLKQAIERDPRAQAGTMSQKELRELAEQAAEVTDKLSKTPLPKKVNDLAAKSPTLKDNIVDLQNKGWTIRLGEAGKGNYADRSTTTIVMDPDSNIDPRDVVENLAHESGHAEFPKPADPPINDGTPPSSAKGLAYIRSVVENSLIDEGQAQIVACKTAKELEATGAKKISIPGQHSDEYKAVYEKMVKGDLNEEAGRKEMAKIMAKEETSTDGKNYIDYYAKKPLEDWNNLHPTAQVNTTDVANLTVFQ
jgi:hypothetical protein